MINNIFADLDDSSGKELLLSEIKDRYGDDVSEEFAALATASNLHGNSYEEAGGLFTGMHYSLPLPFYAIRRVLDICEPDEAYRLYRQDVNALANQQDSDIKTYPDQDLIESICKDLLQEFAEIEGIVDEQINGFLPNM